MEAYYKCEGCGKCFEDANGTTEIADIATWGNLPKNGHTEGTEWKSDKDNHWNACACGLIVVFFQSIRKKGKYAR